MKTLKKALSIILGLAMVLSCVAGMQVSAAAEGNITLRVGEATVADGVVTVPVIATGSIQALTATVDYDDAVLTLVKAEKVAIAGVEDSAAFGPTDAETFKMQWAFALSKEDVVLNNTTIATLTFNVVEGADVDTTAIDLEVTEAWDVAGNAVAATANDGTVTFGPKVDPALKFYAASVGFGTSSLQVSFYVENTVLDSYSDMELVIIPQKYDANLNLDKNVEPVVINKNDLNKAGSKFKSYIYTNIELHEVGLDVDYMLRAYDANGELVAVSETFTTSAASFLKDFIEDQTDAKFRTLIVDTLLVGYEAVARMAVNKPESDLAIDLAENGSIIDGFDYVDEATQEIASYNTNNEFNFYDAAYGEASSFTHRVLNSVAIGKVPYITYRIRDSKSALDLNKLSFKVSYEGFTGPFEKTYTIENGDIALISGWVNFKLYDISLADGDKDIFLEVYYDGAKVYDSLYSVETFLGTQLNNADMGKLASACVKLGISFRAYNAK